MIKLYALVALVFVVAMLGADVLYRLGVKRIVARQEASRD